MPRVRIDNFSGGLNLRDSPGILKSGDTPNSLNWTLDQEGGLSFRPGCVNVSSLPGDSGQPAFIYFSEVLNIWLVARRTGSTNMGLWKKPADLSGSWTSITGTLGSGALGVSTTSVVGFTDWNGATPYVMIVVPTRGVGSGCVCSYDGTTLTQRVDTNAIAATAITTWQNRVWVGGYQLNDASGNATTIFASKIGDPLTWSTASGGLTNDIKDKDGSMVTALAPVGGVLMAFKKRSAYAINNSITAGYRTIDSASGCVGPLSIVKNKGLLFTWGADNLYEWDGVSVGARAGDKVRPLFANNPAVVGTVNAIPGGAYNDRVLFSFPVASGHNADGIVEFDPRHGWIMPHQLANGSANEISSYASKDDVLYAAVMDADAIFSIMSTNPGVDDATVFPVSTYRTPWYEFNEGNLTRILKLQIEGLITYRGGIAGSSTLKLRVYRDWDLSNNDEFDITTALLNNVVLTGGGSNPVLPPTVVDQLEQAIIQRLKHARAYAFEIRATQSGTTSKPNIFISSLTINWTPLEEL